MLVPALAPPAGLDSAVVSRIKLRRSWISPSGGGPRTGGSAFAWRTGSWISRPCVPTMFGESVVLRLLDRGGRPVVLGDLGMPAGIFGAVERISRKPHGLFLVTGPTGSGIRRHSTRRSGSATARQRRSSRSRTGRIRAARDRAGPGAPLAGVTFATALRSVLRQDLDVIMIGELRDRETAEVVVQAAMTGHLVFSTLHTNDAAGAIPRLLDLGVPPFLIAATLEGVLAQRLVRRICDGCRQRYEPEPAALTAFGAAMPMRPSSSRGGKDAPNAVARASVAGSASSSWSSSRPGSGDRSTPMAPPGTVTRGQPCSVPRRCSTTAGRGPRRRNHDRGGAPCRPGVGGPSAVSR